MTTEQRSNTRAEARRQREGTAPPNPASQLTAVHVKRMEERRLQLDLELSGGADDGAELLR